MTARRTRRYSAGMRERRMLKRIHKSTWQRRYEAFKVDGHAASPDHDPASCARCITQGVKGR